MEFQKYLEMHSESPANPYKPVELAPRSVESDAVIVPNSPILLNMAHTVDLYMPLLERMTGLTRRELVLQLMRSGLRGGGISSLVDSLMGAKPVPEPKLVRYVKIVALWVPVFIFLMGGAMVGVFVLYRLSAALLGGVM